MTTIGGVLFSHLQGHLFWGMALVTLPTLLLRPRLAQASSSARMRCC